MDTTHTPRSCPIHIAGISLRRSDRGGRALVVCPPLPLFFSSRPVIVARKGAELGAEPLAGAPPAGAPGGALRYHDGKPGRRGDSWIKAGSFGGKAHGGDDTRPETGVDVRGVAPEGEKGCVKLSQISTKSLAVEGRNAPLRAWRRTRSSQSSHPGEERARKPRTSECSRC